MIAMVWDWLCYWFWDKALRIELYIRAILRRIKNAGWNLLVALNILVCSIAFFGFAKPQETISGFAGRRGLLGSRFFIWLSFQIDRLFPNDPAHCGSTAMMEDEARYLLHPSDVPPNVDRMRDNA